jgi:hypothetical protein
MITTAQELGMAIPAIRVSSLLGLLHSVTVSLFHRGREAKLLTQPLPLAVKVFPADTKRVNPIDPIADRRLFVSEQNATTHGNSAATVRAFHLSFWPGLQDIAAVRTSGPVVK